MQIFRGWIVVAGDMTPRRLGRLVQRLQEIETYRMLAMLGFSVWLSWRLRRLRSASESNPRNATAPDQSAEEQPHPTTN